MDFLQGFQYFEGCVHPSSSPSPSPDAFLGIEGLPGTRTLYMFTSFNFLKWLNVRNVFCLLASLFFLSFVVGGLAWSETTATSSAAAEKPLKAPIQLEFRSGTTAVDPPAVEVASQAPLKGQVEYDERNYRVGAGDVLSVSVYNQPDLSQTEILVRSDGYASFPAIGEIPVEDLTIRELTDTLKQELGQLVRDPWISITVSKPRAGVIYLSGAVKQPGMYQMSTSSGGAAGGGSAISRVDFRLSNILANAGGVTMRADLSHVAIKRGDTGTVVYANLWKVLKQGEAGEDKLVQPGDSIHIPELPEMALNDQDYDLLLRSSVGPQGFPVRIIGEVAKPGVYDLNGQSPYLNTALAMAQGFTEGANRKVVAIRRFTSDHDMSTLFVEPDKLDVTLRPNDVVFVSTLGLYKSGRYFSAVEKLLAPFTNTILTFGFLRNAF